MERDIRRRHASRLVGVAAGRLRVSGLVLCIAVALAAPAIATASGPQPAAGSSIPLLPSDDAFYTYSGPLASFAPGTVLRSRTVSVAWLGLPTPVTATQLLYRTNGQLGAPTVSVTTVLRAANTPRQLPVRILSYQMFYDGLGSACDPSYNLRDASLENFRSTSPTHCPTSTGAPVGQG